MIEMQTVKFSSDSVGEIAAICRYPVKSMMGEELNATAVTPGGLLGDRAFALVDDSNGKVASAKNPKKWPTLFDFQASYARDSHPEPGRTEVFITLPDGTVISGTATDANDVLSHAVGRRVTLQEAAARNPENTRNDRLQAEAYWPDMEGLPGRNEVTNFSLPEGTFFDGAVVHLLTTGTLDRLRYAYPQGRFEARRFRPNLVIRTPDGLVDFVENDWVGRTLAVGDEVLLHIVKPAQRCVMTTLSQRDLPKDTGILKTAAGQNSANVGVYASVARGGRIARGDAIRLV